MDIEEWADWMLSPKFPDLKWGRKFILIPRKSIGGNIVWGICWKRDILIPINPGDGPPMMTHKVEKEYASNKEYFLEKLKDSET